MYSATESPHNSGGWYRSEQTNEGQQCKRVVFFFRFPLCHVLIFVNLYVEDVKMKEVEGGKQEGK